jgi:SAM-dependent methyltransferase
MEGMKIQFGHGGHILDGWMNLEQHQADITKPLAFKNDSVDFILIEHCLEHVTPAEGYRFLKEALRILKRKGVIRVIVPDLHKMWLHCDDRYLSLLQAGLRTWWPAAGLMIPHEGYKPTAVDAVESLIFCHGHKSVYNEDLLSLLMEVAGFDCTPCDYLKSNHKELDGVDSHWRYMGLENCVLESCVVEGTKRV